MRATRMVLLGVLLSSCAHIEDARRRAEIAAQSTGICHVHRVEMKKLPVPLIYGYVIFPPEKEVGRRAARSQFPFSGGGILAGCELGLERTTQAWVCERCGS